MLRRSILSLRFIGALLAAVAFLHLPPVALGSPQSSNAAIVVKGECRSMNGSKACDECDITLSQRHGVKVASGVDSLTGACPLMAAGDYELSIKIPVKLIPATPLASKTLFQASASFGARARQPGSGKTAVLLHTDPLSWSWWSKDGMIIDKVDRIRVARDAAVEIAFVLADARYYVPGQTEGAAHRDGELLIDQGAIIRLKASHPT